VFALFDFDPDAPQFVADYETAWKIVASQLEMDNNQRVNIKEAIRQRFNRGIKEIYRDVKPFFIEKEWGWRNLDAYIAHFRTRPYMPYMLEWAAEYHDIPSHPDMDTALSWIKAYVPDLDVTPSEYTDAMTLTGTKVEGYKELDKNLEKSKFGIMEPEINSEEIIAKDAHVFVPLIGLDKNKKRLGFGGGFYDRYFGKHRENTLYGLAYDFQVDVDFDVNKYAMIKRD